jgi:tetratricopeptide (TPR) repeat protein
MGLMSKAMIITLPILLLLIDYWPLKRLGDSEVGQRTNWMRLVREKIPLLFLSIGSALMTIDAAQRNAGALATSALLPLGWRIKNALYSYLVYILKGLWPTHLAVFYPHPENSLQWWKVVVAMLFLLAISVVVWRFRQRKYLVAGWLWYLVTLLPVIGIVQAGRQAMADRYAYISFLGLFVIVVWLVGESASHSKMLHSVATVAVLAILTVYGYITYIQVGYWRNSYTLFAHALQVTKQNGIAEDNFGVALEEMGEPGLAMPHFENAIRWMPQLSTAHYNLGTLLHRQNHLTEAMNEYDLALRYCGDPVEAARIHNNRGAALSQLNQPKAAISEFGEAIRINPNEANSFLGRGLIEYGMSNVSAAQDDFSRAAQIAPSSNSWYWLGRTLEDKKDFGSALQAYENALRDAPNMEDAKSTLMRFVPKHRSKSRFFLPLRG